LTGPKQRKGLTLIELIVMLAVVMILTLIAIPSFTNITQHYRITSAAENLYAALQYARTESIKQNANIYVSFTTGDSWCYGINSGSTCNCATAGSCNLGSYSAPGPGLLSLSATGLSSNSIYYSSVHGGVSSAATITFTLYGQSSLITTSISTLGEIQTCSTGIIGYNAC
jgi:Tfp pilus assembly protein FimT